MLVNRQRRNLAIAALFLSALAFCVAGMGAWVRLSDAGLSCPDWPGCYGQLLGVPESEQEIAAAKGLFPDKPVDAERASKEMLHRYLAGALGLGILLLTIYGWKRSRHADRALLLVLLLLVIGQSLLGMLTVTRLLMPKIVTLHLLGGVGTFALLLLIAARSFSHRAAIKHPFFFTVRQGAAGPRLLGWFSLLAIVIQIALGGWVSSNYAALACSGFPLCNGSWWPAGMDFVNAFQPDRQLGFRADGGLLGNEALLAIHMAHRAGALLVTCLLLSYVFVLWKFPLARLYALLLFVILCLQITLGIANVLLQLPLSIALLHNLGATGLLALCVLSIHRVEKNMRITAERAWGNADL